jgi:hypothetical protein
LSPDTVIADGGTYAVSRDPGTYTVQVKIEGNSDYFPSKSAEISAGNVTNVLVFSNGIEVGIPGAVNRSNNLWILNRLTLTAVTGVEIKSGSDAYSPILEGSMPLAAGGHAGLYLEPGTYTIKVALEERVAPLEKPNVIVTSEPVFVIVQLGVNGEELVEISPGDSDNDGFPDWWEKKYFPDAVNNPDLPGRGRDADNDGLSNWDEYIRGTDPTNKDTDGDGLTDWEEINGQKDANFPRDDDIPREFPTTDPLKYDTDRDGYSDYVEVREGSDPNDPNSRPRGATIIIPIPWGE